MSAKKFREDLYYRLNVVRIHLPPLRERREDVRLLVDYFLQRLAKSGTSPGRVMKISSEALKILDRSPWPGNVRELENVIERSAVVARGDSILPKDLPAEVREPRAVAVPPEDLTAAIDAAVRPLYALAKKDPSLKIMAAGGARIDHAGADGDQRESGAGGEATGDHAGDVAQAHREIRHRQTAGSDREYGGRAGLLR